jgi:hypothetical protein
MPKQEALKIQMHAGYPFVEGQTGRLTSAQTAVPEAESRPGRLRVGILVQVK